MSSFTEAEIAYLKSQRLGRLATLNAAGAPQIAPVGFRYNAETDTIDIGGHNIGASVKYRNIQQRATVAFVVDDVVSDAHSPWQPRGVEIRGRAEALATGGKAVVATFDEELIRIHPTRIISWGIERGDGNAGGAYQRNSRNVQDVERA